MDYLNGQEIPNIRRMETPGTLGFVWDIYLDWGISVMDYRGAIKNPGVEVKNPIDWHKEGGDKDEQSIILAERGVPRL